MVQMWPVAAQMGRCGKSRQICHLSRRVRRRMRGLARRALRRRLRWIGRGIHRRGAGRLLGGVGGGGECWFGRRRGCGQASRALSRRRLRRGWRAFAVPDLGYRRGRVHRRCERCGFDRRWGRRVVRGLRGRGFRGLSGWRVRRCLSGFNRHVRGVCTARSRLRMLTSEGVTGRAGSGS